VLLFSMQLSFLVVAGCKRSEPAETESVKARPCSPSEDDERKARLEVLKQFDTDGNGTIDEAERLPLVQARVKDILSDADTDQDGRISSPESRRACAGISRRVLRDFKQVDSDGDSYVSRDELHAAVSRGRPRRDRSEGVSPGPGRPQPPSQNTTP
jgi:Ca2+-binding EF-hand superfamily protein